MKKYMKKLTVAVLTLVLAFTMIMAVPMETTAASAATRSVYVTQSVGLKKGRILTMPV